MWVQNSRAGVKRVKNLLFAGLPATFGPPPWTFADNVDKYAFRAVI